MPQGCISVFGDWREGDGMGRSKHESAGLYSNYYCVLLVKMPEIALDNLKMVFKPNIFIPAVLVFRCCKGFQ